MLDTVGGEIYVRSFKVLKKGGRIVSMLEEPRQELMKEFDVEAFSEFAPVTTDRLIALATLVDQGVLRVHIDKVFPLDQASAALLHLEKDSPRGKVVLKVA